MPGLPGQPEGAVDLPGLQLVAESIVRLEDDLEHHFVRHLRAFEALT